MKEVNLCRPAIIADVLRYPVENPLTVSDAEAKRLEESGSLEKDTTKKPAAAGKEA
ncbi:hypothetical protein PQ455_01495 [Sphingomonas naphthae]|uniref:Uncharacterized protein n=1 Tax=Sphingomonas naphthae TaxID=1813468 RepID=A0ABY7TLW3_9SPHN|nr:hypothetical protein [Sphingomonas naphthae]WCT73935.1 hypothetical protein PQ455_01495 [Sphingomonas naphthae]